RRPITSLQSSPPPSHQLWRCPHSSAPHPMCYICVCSVCVGVYMYKCIYANVLQILNKGKRSHRKRESGDDIGNNGNGTDSGHVMPKSHSAQSHRQRLCAKTCTPCQH